MNSTKTPFLILAILGILISCSAPKEEQEQQKQPTEAEIKSPAAENTSLPYLITGHDGKLYMSWVEKKDSGLVQLKYAMLEDEWSTPELIAEGNDWFVNWADYPMITADDQGNMVAHYLAKSSSGTYSYDVNVVIKSKENAYWSEPLIPHTDGTPTEHGFVSLLPKNDGTFLLAWLDGRNTGGGSHDTHSGGAMTVRAAVMDLEGNLSDEEELDNRVCDCCQTGAAMTSQGPVVVYRDRSADEVRDMAFVIHDGEKWSDPAMVAADNWEIAGCPVNGPRVASKDSTTTVAWFSSANGRPTVKVAFKKEDSFNEPIIVDASSPLGRVDVILLDEESAIVSWMAGGETPSIRYRKVHATGSMSEPITVTTISGSRGSGFPQMEIHKGALYFAWTEMGDVERISMKVIKI